MRALVFTVPAGDAELAADRLFAAGVAAVEERPCGEGRVELRTYVGDAKRVIADAVAMLDSAPAGEWRFRTIEVDDRVADAWREHAEPTWIDPGFVVVPAWQADPDAGAALQLAIDPGAAFGMGDHPTTVLCLRALRAVIADGGPPQRVLDVGCGSGVLGIAAAKLGAGEVHSIDIHAPAVEATAANAARNGVHHVVHASGASLGEAVGSGGAYDLAFANILAPTLIALADDLIRAVYEGGTLVVSGTLADRDDRVIEALHPLAVRRRWTLDGWSAVELVAAR